METLKQKYFDKSIKDICLLRPKDGLAVALLLGFEDIIPELKQRLNGDYKRPMEKAIEMGISSSKFFLFKEWGVTDFNKPMAWAAGKGRKSIVKQCRFWGATKFDKGMAYAAMGGHKKLVLYFKKWGARDFDKGMDWAADGGHEELVKLFKEWGAREYNTAMLSAARHGHLVIVKLCVEWEAEDCLNFVRNNPGGLHMNQCNVETGLFTAAQNGHKDLVVFFKEMGARSFNDAMVAAVHKDHREIILLLKEWGANDFNDVASEAARCNRKEIVELCLAWGITDYTQALKFARCRGNTEIASLLEEASVK